MRRSASTLLAASLLCACDRGASEPDMQTLRVPTGAMLAPDANWLFVTNGNIDLGAQASTMVALDLQALDRALAGPPGVEDAELTSAEPCRTSRRRPGDVAVIECAERYLIQRERSVRLANGAGNISLDLPAGGEGPWRLLIPSSHDRTVTWLDVVRTSGGIEVSCGQDREGDCDRAHQLTRVGDSPSGTRLPADPARLFVGDTFRYSYVPHLLGDRMTLIALDAEFGPSITDIAEKFFVAGFDGNGPFAGGFSVVQRPCDIASPPAATQGCSRPLLYVSQRFWPGVQMFSVETGRDRLIGLSRHSFLVVNPEETRDRPFMGALAFEDPEAGERLLAVHTTPPSLSLVDTSLDPAMTPYNRPLANIPLCENPNLLAVHRPQDNERIAFVSCYSADKVAAVALGSFDRIALIDVDDGPNELVVDEARKKLYVVHTLASTIGIVELDRTSSSYLQMTHRIGGTDV